QRAEQPKRELSRVDHFDYRQGILHAEDVSLADIAARFGTSTYVYSAATLTRHYGVFADALADMLHKPASSIV
ncbi:MAG: hypothetical protein PF501_03450, partial [Salinisphaera sp.]|nr:hypothetical protein [Salinisphaera sp.]